jgi:hypothetical protein
VVRYYPKDIKENIPAFTFQTTKHGGRDVVAGCRQHLVPLRIPRPDISTQMVFVRGSEKWTPEFDWSMPGWIWPEEGVRIPAFYVDQAEMLCNDGLQKNPAIDEATGQVALPSAYFQQANYFMELSGKRLPTLTELAYLSEQAQHFVDGKPSACSGKEVTGLLKPPEEFSSTVCPNGKPVLGFGNRYVLAGHSALAPGDHDRRRLLTAKARGEWQGSSEDGPVAVRGVRSAKPRRTAEAFLPTSK